MKTSDFDYLLAEELIAQTPIEPRDHSRLMVLSRHTGKIQHRRFYDLPDYLEAGDVIVFNDSRVFPARLYAKRTDTSAQVELLLLDRRTSGEWRALVKPGRRMGPGATFEVADDEGLGISGEVVDVESDGSRIVHLLGEERLQQLGVVPLPPYIHEPLADAERYQTVYSRLVGSVAAPTAGLHFDQPMLEQLQAMGVETGFVTLHVGAGTFQPVRVERVEDHPMHSERFRVEPTLVEQVAATRARGGRVVAVGTTALRTLEAASAGGVLEAGESETDIFIYPGYRFRQVDALVTNFHLPRSTLLMLVSAFAGRERVLAAYEEAIRERYRFFSYGDAMFIERAPDAQRGFSCPE